MEIPKEVANYILESLLPYPFDNDGGEVEKGYNECIDNLIKILEGKNNNN